MLLKVLKIRYYIPSYLDEMETLTDLTISPPQWWEEGRSDIQKPRPAVKVPKKLDECEMTLNKSKIPF